MIMKQLRYILLGALFAFSCTTELETAFSVSENQLVVAADGGEQTLRVTSASEWVAIASEPWVSVSPSNGYGSVDCAIRVDSSLVSTQREAFVRFSPVGQPAQTIKIQQWGFERAIVPEFTEKSIKNTARYDERYFDVKVTTNVDFDVEIESDGHIIDKDNAWLSVEDYDVVLDRKARPRTLSLRFNWKMNPDPEKRSVNVRFVPKGSEPANGASLSVAQDAAPRIEDNRAGDSLAVLTINEKLQSMTSWDPSENMMHWSDVELWDEADKDLPAPEAVGRVKYVRFFLLNTKESLPQEVKYLKYAETIAFYGNTNTMNLSIGLGPEICALTNLKNLQVAAYGLVSLPDELAQMKQLEALDFSSNNFSEIPSVLTPENFPNLKELNLGGQRRGVVTDLRNKGNGKYADGIGLHLDLWQENDSNMLNKLLTWDKLEYLAFTYSYLEGPLPDFKIGDRVGDKVLTGYTEEDAVNMGLRDTIAFLYDPAFNRPAGAPVGTQIPKILPNAKSLKINLNFLTGNIPDWILYHPHLMDWFPETFIFTQQEKGMDSRGKMVGFDNVPADFEYYYAAYPHYREKYYISEESTEEE